MPCESTAPVNGNRGIIRRRLNAVVAGARADRDHLWVGKNEQGIGDCIINALLLEFFHQHLGILVRNDTEFPDVELEHMLVDAMAMISIQRPASLGVVATSNMFGDILSDECSVLAGGLGMLPSGSFGEPGPSFYEPVHGSAPDIAGQGVANPIGAILSAAMLAEHSLGSIEVAQAMVNGVRAALASGLRTRDIAGGGGQVVGTEAFTQAVLEQLTAARA